MQYDESPFGSLEARRASLAAQHENTARMAKFYATWVTKGIGEVIISECLKFSITFLHEPAFTSGIALGDDVDLVPGHFPRATCGVYEWDRNSKGYYTGAYLFFVVDTLGPGQSVGNEPSYEIIHHLTWEGTAMKDLPSYLLDF